MDIEEAKGKFSISVPSDEIFYSPEYMQYFTTAEQGISSQYEDYRLFDEMFEKSKYLTFERMVQRTAETQDFSYKDSKAVILGGQAGAGKSSLAGVAMREAQEQQLGMCVIDDDEFRKFYPRHEDIIKECPEHYTSITAIGSATITPKIMRFASDNGINFIFDGTMKNPRIIDTAMKWKGYDINWKIMATSRLESLISVFERGKILKEKGFCRSLTVDIHDETYLGLPSTLTLLESMKNMGRIQVYRRGEDIKNPILIYDSERRENPYNTAVSALIGGRQEDRRRCIKAGVEERLERLKEGYFDLNAAERRALDDLIRSINFEMDK